VVAVAALAAECLKPGVLKRGMQCIVADRARWAERWRGLDRLLDS
jgi:hypothetical protein